MTQDTKQSPDCGQSSLTGELERQPVARRCPDFDDECVDVEDHAACFAGGVKVVPVTDCVFELTETDIADGYCPFTVGMLRPKANMTGLAPEQWDQK